MEWHPAASEHNQRSPDGLMVFPGNDYNEDDVVEVDGDPAGLSGVYPWWYSLSTAVNGQIVGGSKLVVVTKLKDLKIEKPYSQFRFI